MGRFPLCAISFAKSNTPGVHTLWTHTFTRNQQTSSSASLGIELNTDYFIWLIFSTHEISMGIFIIYLIHITIWKWKPSHSAVYYVYYSIHIYAYSSAINSYLIERAIILSLLDIYVCFQGYYEWFPEFQWLEEVDWGVHYTQIEMNLIIALILPWYSRAIQTGSEDG